jgi:hypothetical protein
VNGRSIPGEPAAKSGDGASKGELPSAIGLERVILGVMIGCLMKEEES